MSRYKLGSLAERIAFHTVGYDTSTPIVNGCHCLVTDLTVATGGYPSIRDENGKNGRPIRVSRAVWEQSTGTKITSAEHVLHHCDNPACIEFRHLFLGDQTLNDTDRDAKGRQAWGERAGGSKLTAIEVHAIRADPRPNKELGMVYNVGANTIRRIKRRDRWGRL